MNGILITDDRLLMAEIGRQIVKQKPEVYTPLNVE